MRAIYLINQFIGLINRVDRVWFIITEHRADESRKFDFEKAQEIRIDGT